jgi:hypothetical protein
MPVTAALQPQPPLLNPAAEVTLLAGDHAGYRFDASGAMLRGAGLSTSHVTTAHANKLGTIPGRSGSWYYLVDGPLDGYWVAESSEVFLTAAPTATPSPTPAPTP